MYEGDVTKLSGEKALELAGVKPGELDVLDGSPPCQGFSTSGKRVFTDQRNALWQHYVRMVETFQPRAFVMENVQGMVGGVMRKIYLQITRSLREAGYTVKGSILNCAHFGVAQSRKRVIVIGIRDDLKIEPSHPAPQTAPIRMDQVLPSLNGVLFDSGGKGSWGPREFASSGPAPTLTRQAGQFKAIIQHPEPPPLDDKYGKLYDQIPQGKNASHVLGVGHGTQGCRKPNPDKPSPTLVKMQVGNGYGTVVHPVIRRALTIEEALLLSGFPLDFKMTGSYVERWAILGNCVPPPLIKAVAEHVKLLLRSSA